MLSDPPAMAHLGTAEAQPGLAGCQVSVQAAAPTVTAGETVSLLGALVCQEATVAANQSLTVYQRAAGTPGFSAIGTASTEASGSYQSTTPALSSNSSFYVRVGSARQRPRIRQSRRLR